jgi:DNA polymerase I-like protein with 3'-5' exonuclease and polymerase domains
LLQGSGGNNVLLLADTFDASSVVGGKVLQGRTGMWFAQTLLRKGLKRDDFWIDSCLPLAGGGITPKVIVPLGDFALSQVLGEGERLVAHRGYVTWSPRFHCWVLPTYAPSQLVRGNQNLTGVFLHDLSHAVEIAERGFVPHTQKVWEDPPPFVTMGWVEGYEAALRADPATTLAYDIETPYKDAEADEGTLDEGDPSFQILRVGFAYKGGDALSIPFQAHYLSAIRRLLGSKGVKLVWNGRYDNPRLLYNQVPIGGEIWDLMWGWHVINSDLPKGLAFVAPLLAKGQQRWKHLGRNEPARYNGIDAEVTWRIGETLCADLKAHHLWEPFHNHIVRLDVVLDAMSSAGVHTDLPARAALSADLEAELDTLASKMQAVVPLEAKRLKTYKKAPKTLEWAEGDAVPDGFTTVEAEVAEAFCPGCAASRPPSTHFKVFKKKVNPCGGLTPSTRSVIKQRLARIEKFVPSNAQMLSYAQQQGHVLRYTKGVKSKAKERRVTFDDMALGELRKAYPADPLYPLVGEYREIEKLLGTYVGYVEDGRWVGGPPCDFAGVVHTLFTHAPSTLRLSSRNPNLQNIPRGGTKWADRVKTLYIPAEGHAFFEADYKAIEAVLVGLFANDPIYTRLAKLGVHDYLNSHILKRQGKIGQAADIAWSDADLKALFKDLKNRFKAERDIAKRIVHGGNYGMSARRMRDLNPDLFPTLKDAVSLQSLYFEVCPGVRRWQEVTINQAEDTGYLRNPFGYIHRFFQVKEYRKQPDGTWESVWGEDAKRVLAFLPQSTAAGLIKEALLKIWYNSAWGRSLRLQVHDSLLCEFPLACYQEGAKAVAEMMATPSPFLELPWAPGTFLDIEVECKFGGAGTSWGKLKEGVV